MTIDHEAFYKLVVALRNKQKEYSAHVPNRLFAKARLLKSVLTMKLSE